MEAAACCCVSQHVNSCTFTRRQHAFRHPDTTVKHKLLMCLLCTIAQSLNWTHSQTHTHTRTRSILSPRGSIRTILFLMWILLYGLHLGVYRVQRELCPYGNSMSHTHTQTNAGAHIHTQNFPSNGIALIFTVISFFAWLFPARFGSATGGRGGGSKREPTS